VAHDHTRPARTDNSPGEKPGPEAQSLPPPGPPAQTPPTTHRHARYDDNGNLIDDETYKFYYDFANHLVAVVRQSDSDTIAQYTYDALSRRVKKVVDDVSDTLDGTTLFYYDGLRVIERGRLDAQNAYKATHQHVWGLYLDELMVYGYDADADGDFDGIAAGTDKRYYALQDFIYSVVCVVNPSGAVQERYDYRPYGARTFWCSDYSDTRDETHVTNTFLFTGQMYDGESGLYHYKFRALHPLLGRFLQRDPISSMSTSGLYDYCRGRVGAAADPFGLQLTITVRHANRRTVRCCWKTGEFRVSASTDYDRRPDGSFNDGVGQIFGFGGTIVNYVTLQCECEVECMHATLVDLEYLHTDFTDRGPRRSWVWYITEVHKATSTTKYDPAGESLRL
jgi:RHS repeat-associated protein